MDSRDFTRASGRRARPRFVDVALFSGGTVAGKAICIEPVAFSYGSQ